MGMLETRGKAERHSAGTGNRGPSSFCSGRPRARVTGGSEARRPRTGGRAPGLAPPPRGLPRIRGRGLALPERRRGSAVRRPAGALFSAALKRGRAATPSPGGCLRPSVASSRAGVSQGQCWAGG